MRLGQKYAYIVWRYSVPDRGTPPAGTRRRFDVEIWSKCGRDVDRLNFDVVSTSPCRRVI